MRFIFDLDGTICFKGQPISAAILDSLLWLEQEGHTVGFASARPCRDMLPVLDERFARHLLIGANGAMTYQHGRLQAYTPIPAPLATEIISILTDHRAQFLIDDKWDYAHNCTGDQPILRHIDSGRLASRIAFDQLGAVLKILIVSAEGMDELSARLRELDVTLHYHSAEGILNLTCKGVNKFAALQQAAPEEKFICFGNDMNDLPLFERAHHSVLLGEYAPLVPLATEQIPVDDQVEHAIVAKIQELGMAYRSVRTS
ncbi:HAD-IIB family hydrolase [Brevibacillus agri]|uniref:HAD-IIB family hydrolase n=1 Tax=Brevibacillus agri TaxID=51101 RepID=UPI002E1C7AEC|nr:HAD-IIB family hydrolase [Brevibacillus agri]MED1643954.1 HAD-IIB family hydrolase [Brevibacillus agri]MED1654501.1 HAD-IIB family hydrolase [Brevibacillus agri]MED1686050.1 HAD-IIB family hydrolase [Brevibacillus agri]MED1690478.1 HAD-IIB family hydrolase [Brevibacillus agri]MED1695635.1 HAD-IIB family hydrolase [Brevibacillus agri]